ncbi:MAG: M56 family metallopeptidase, partial [Pseudomonadota bacterium]
RFLVTLKTVIELLGTRRLLGANTRPAVLLRQLIARRRSLLGAPKVTVNERGAGPVSLPNHEICLPQWVAQRLSDKNLKAVLAHELAHCLRMDALWLLFSNILRRVLFFQPLLHLAHHRMADVAEMIADEMAVSMTGDQKAVAESLTQCAEQAVLEPAWGAAMASRPSTFLVRVRRLLEPELFQQGAPGWPLKLISLATLVVLVLVAPTFSIAQDDVVVADEPAEVHEQHKDDLEEHHDGHVEAVERAHERERKRHEAMHEREMERARQAHRQVEEQAERQAAMEAREMEREIRRQELKLEKEARRVEEAMRREERAVVLQARQVEREVRPTAAKEKREKTDSVRVGTMTRIETDDNGNINVIDITQRKRGYMLKVKGRGNFELNDDETDVSVMDRGARLDVEERDGKTTRKVRFKRSGSEISKQYWLNGKTVEPDEDMEAWVIEILPRLMRETGFNAKQRVGQIHRQGGADSVLNEIGLISGDHVRRIYIQALTPLGDLNRHQFSRLMDQAGTIDSDFESRQALTSIASDLELTNDRAIRILKTAESIDSDFELRSLSTYIMSHSDVEKLAPEQLVKLIATMDSDFEMRHAFSTLLSDTEVPSETLPKVVLIAGRSIDSDFELRSLLQQVASRIDRHPDLPSAYLSAAGEIDSDFERRAALGGFAKYADADSLAWAGAIKVASGIDSDFECAEALLQIVRRMPTNQENIDLYRQVMQNISSDLENRRVRDALDERLRVDL